MTDDKGSQTAGLTRRAMMGAGGVCLATLAMAARAADGSGKPRFSLDSERTGTLWVPNIHAGKGKTRIKLFPFDGAPAPANFIIYDLPPGASEGVHVHYLDSRNREGSFDEYYYILSGEGQMEIDGEIVKVVEGDHVHTPLEVAHGIENTHAEKNLRVFLTFIKRGAETSIDLK